MAMTFRPDALLNNEDAAEFLSIKPQTLNLWRSTGRYNLPYLKVGRNVRYRRSDLEAFLASCERRHTGESDE